jgi:hypothetical protein
MNRRPLNEADLIPSAEMRFGPFGRSRRAPVRCHPRSEQRAIGAERRVLVGTRRFMSAL